MVIRLLPLHLVYGLGASLSLYLGSQVVQSLSLAIIVAGGSSVTWEGGCLYRRVVKVPFKDVPECGRCITGGENLAKFETETRESYRNCSIECKRPTVCTVYHYRTGNKELAPVCYECDRFNEETVINFKFRRSHQICSEDCKVCGREADLATANSCAFKCGGKPTFCYPNKTWFGHEICHQSEKTFGCLYKISSMLEQIRKREKFRDCLACIRLTAEPGSWAANYHNLTKFAQMCAPLCDGTPSYMRLNDERTALNIYECTLATHMELLDVDIPHELKYFIRPETVQLARNVEYRHS